MNFGSNTAKFKSGFGVEGSQLNPKKGITGKTEKPDFAASQKINKASLPTSYRQTRTNKRNVQHNDNSHDDVNTASQTINIQ